VSWDESQKLLPRTDPILSEGMTFKKASPPPAVTRPPLVTRQPANLD
jgi:hypothetical protein